HRNTPDPDTKRLRRQTACRLKVALGLTLEIVAYPARHMGLFARNTEQMFIRVTLDPDGAACTAPMLDAVFAAAQRQHGTVCKRSRGGEPLEPCPDPGTVFLGEIFRLFHAAARRHGEHDFASCGVYAKRVAARLPMPAHVHEINLAVEMNRDRRRLAGAAKKQGAQRCRHGRPRIRSGGQSAKISAKARDQRWPTPLRGGARSSPPPLRDSTKSAMRGAISAWKREPL